MTLPVSDSANVTIPLSDWNRIQRDYDQMREALKNGATHAPIVPVEAQAALDALESALPIVQFAVGNVPPESVRGWPVASLETLADQIEALFPQDADRQSMAIAFREVAGHARKVDNYRAARAEAASRVVAETTVPVENS